MDDALGWKVVRRYVRIARYNMVCMTVWGSSGCARTCTSLTECAVVCTGMLGFAVACRILLGYWVGAQFLYSAIMDKSEHAAPLATSHGLLNNQYSHL